MPLWERNVLVSQINEWEPRLRGFETEDSSGSALSVEDARAQGLI